MCSVQIHFTRQQIRSAFQTALRETGCKMDPAARDIWFDCIRSAIAFLDDTESDSDTEGHDLQHRLLTHIDASYGDIQKYSACPDEDESDDDGSDDAYATGIVD
jgi:hypothetical protein